jgi:ribose transport system substrate-binding protein
MTSTASGWVRGFAMLMGVAWALVAVGCDKAEDKSAGGSAQSSGNAGGAGGAKRTVRIGFVGKSDANMVFQVARNGANAAQRELGSKYGVTLEVIHRTPNQEDAAKQVEAIDALVRDRVDGIAVSCSQAATLKPAIDRAVDAGIPVITFDSDSPDSKRFAYYGTDDEPAAHKLIDLLARSMGEKGTIAILAGNEAAPNLQARVRGAKAQLAKYPNMKLLENGVFYHEETPEKAAERVATATAANPSIQGWAFVGGWPLFTNNALKWPAGQIKVASWDAMPAQLGYLRSGHVDVLLAQDCFGWGYKSVEILLDKIVNKKDPPSPRVIDPLTEVTRDNVDAFAKKWEEWLK